ncbi:MAG: hypothetical protein F4122_01330 [Gammaproteobacteria bacterium]|nr:hypothetical protein [Gammaproteobacteria bacterium]
MGVHVEVQLAIRQPTEHQWRIQVHQVFVLHRLERPEFKLDIVLAMNFELFFKGICAPGKRSQAEQFSGSQLVLAEFRRQDEREQHEH